MKKLLLVAYVFGTTYQDYIPLYILSALSTYPEWDIRIYLDNELKEAIKYQLGLLNKYSSHFSIVENFSSQSKFSEKASKISQIQKSQRWLFYDDLFSKYNAIYIGDIDLIILPEKLPLYDQHLKHCEFLNMPYSNISRKAKQYNKKSLKRMAYNLVKFGFAQTLDFYTKKQDEIIKLSGLHYIKTKEYFENVRPLFDIYYNELNLLARGKSKKYNLCTFNNEGMLRDMIIDSGLGAPQITTELDYNIEVDPNKLSYRPHHGLHLGIFRSDQSIELESEVVNNNEYVQFYKEFLDLKNTQEFVQLSPYFSPYLNEILARLENYYNALVG